MTAYSKALLVWLTTFTLLPGCKGQTIHSTRQNEVADLVVIDHAGWLSKSEADSIRYELLLYENSHKMPIRVYLTRTSDTSHSAVQLAQQVADTLGLSYRGLQNGVLLYLGPRRGHIRTSPGVNWILTDSIVSRVWVAMKPSLQADRFASAIHTFLDSVHSYVDTVDWNVYFPLPGNNGRSDYKVGKIYEFNVEQIESRDSGYIMTSQIVSEGMRVKLRYYSYATWFEQSFAQGDRVTLYGRVRRLQPMEIDYVGRR